MHSERHTIFLQWQETAENIRKRDQLITETGDEYAQNKNFLDRKNAELEDAKKNLEREIRTNKETETALAMDERELAKTRESMARLDTDKENLQGEVAILRNQLSAFATELSNKRINVSNMNKILSDKMERLEAAKKKYNATKDRLGKEENAQDNLESANKQADGEFNEAQTMQTEIEKEIRNQKESLFKESQKLFKLRAEQANLIGDISGTLSASKNLKANIQKLN